MELSVKEARFANMAIIHNNYDKLMAQGPALIKAVADAISNPDSGRKGTRIEDANTFEVSFTCFSVPLLLRVEFDMPTKESVEEDQIQGDLVLYKRIEDEEPQRFDFVKDLAGRMVNSFRYNARGYVVGYEPSDKPNLRMLLDVPAKSHLAYFKDCNEFPAYFLDTLERYIAASGIRIIPK